MATKKYTDEQKNEVIRLYKEGRTYRQIATEVHLTQSTVNNILYNAKVERRINQQTAAKVKTCIACHRKITLKDAKFCPYCGTLAMTEKEQLIEKVKWLFGLATFLPESSRDEYHAVLSKVVEELKK